MWAFLAGRQVWRPPQGPEKTFPPLERHKEEEHWYQQAPLCQATSLHMNTNLAEFSSDLRFIILVDNLEFSSAVDENAPDFSVQKY